jgi:hypothetical protein
MKPQDIGALLSGLLEEQRAELARLHERLEKLERQLQEPPGEEWITKRAFLKRHTESFTEGSLDWLLFHRETNGLALFVRKPGKVLLIQERRFLAAVLALGPATSPAGAPTPRRRRSRASGHAKRNDGPWRRFANRQEP